MYPTTLDLKDTMVEATGTADGAAFAQALSALKERGSNLLVVGGVLDGAHGAACDRLQGDVGGPPRHRLFVRTDGSSGCGIKPGLSTGETRVVAQETATRSAAAAASPAGPDAGARTRHVEAGDPGALAAAIVDEIDDLSTGELEPGQLRVCFDSLLPLLGEYEEDEVFRVLNLVTTRVRQVNGMGHYHLPVDTDEHAVSLLEPQFDAVIELRADDDGPEHRWELVEHEVDSGWLPL